MCHVTLLHGAPAPAHVHTDTCSHTHPHPHDHLEESAAAAHDSRDLIARPPRHLPPPLDKPTLALHSSSSQKEVFTTSTAFRAPLSLLSDVYSVPGHDPTAAGTDDTFNLREDTEVDGDPARDRAVRVIGVMPEEHHELSEGA
ncbi:hypothetical protein BJV78DRAFT_1277597 [Lactifluus subvellereus]|nr:hypothetical protein BJV78DRAFT_1277597 [Lactifluus subvellereus]